MSPGKFFALLGTVAALGVAALVAASCSSQDEQGELVGSTSEGLVTAALQNYPPTGTITKRNETDSTWVPGDGGRTPGNWIVAWNAGVQNQVAGWAYSGDVNGTTWTTKEMSSPTQFGDPDASPCDGGNFTGWAGDPSVAPVYDTTINNGGTRALYVNIGTHPNEDDIVIAKTDDQGKTWNSARYVDDKNSCGGADTGWVASNPVSPYDTYVSWDTSSGGFLQRVWYDAAGTFHTGFTTPLAIPDVTTTKRHRLAFVKLPSGCTSGGEGVVIATTLGVETVRCGHGNYTTHLKWSLMVYDTAAPGGGKFYPLGVVQDSPNENNCLTYNIRTTDDGGTGPAVYNQPDPSVATNPETSDVWMTCSVNTVTGNAIRIVYGSIVCTNGSPALPSPKTWTSPCAACSASDGGPPIVQDEWEPTIGFAKTPLGHKRVVAYWYGTREDVNNKLIGTYFTWSEDGSAFATPTKISFKTTGSMEVLPWNMFTAGVPVYMWDYNHIGVNAYGGTLLGAWGGDNRLSNNGMIESELFQ